MSRNNQGVKSVSYSSPISPEESWALTLKDMDPTNMFGMFSAAGLDPLPPEQQQQQQQQWMQMQNMMGFNMMGMNFNAPMPFMSMPMMQQPTAPAPANIQKPRAASAAAGSAEQLKSPVGPIQMKRCIEDGEEEDRPKKKVNRSYNKMTITDKEEEDTKKASSKFQAFMEKLNLKKGASKVSESDSDGESSDNSVYNKKSKGKKKRRNILKKELRVQAHAQREKLEELLKRERELIEESKRLKLKLKKKAQENPDEVSDAIIISDDDISGLPMSFEWDRKDNIVDKKGENSLSVHKETKRGEVGNPSVQEDYDWTAEEADGTFLTPEDDFSYIDGSEPTEEIPFVDRRTVVVDSLKRECKACKVSEAEYEITFCGHIGLCDTCKDLYGGCYKRCPGCFECHLMELKRVFF